MNNNNTTYDNDRRFIFNNWSNEDFDGQWGGQITNIKAGETREFPMYLAYHFAKHFIDKEMYKAGKEMMVGVEESRREFEIKTITEITGSIDSPALSALKEKIKKEIESNIKEESVVKIKKSGKINKKEVVEEAPTTTEFEDIKK